MSGLKQTQYHLPTVTVTLLRLIVPWLIFTGLLYIVSLYNYLLFHSLAELFSIAVVTAVFMLVWNTRRFMDNNFLFFVSTAYLFAGFIDIFHTLTYKGMGILPGNDANLPTQLWIAARYLQSISFLVAVLLIRRKVDPRLLIGGLTTVTALLMASIFTGLFPDCYANGLTPFKKVSEYIISGIFVGAALRLKLNADIFHPRVHRLIQLSIGFTTLAELAFTSYVSVYELPNFLGHLFKILAVYCLYKCVIETGLNQPFDLLFHGMKKRELDLERSYKLLEEIALRDPLTGLPNRLLFETRLTHALEKAQRNNYDGQRNFVQLIIMDVDDFKAVNDRLGHLGGDEVLREIGWRLRVEIRESDTVARWGGDEFTCILEDLPSIEAAEYMAQKILRAMTKPLQVQGQELIVTTSLGYSLFPTHSEDQETLLRYADMALYRAKETKRNFRAYDESMDRLDRSVY